METTIKVTKETARRIQRVKYSLDCKTADETINKLLDIIEKIEEASEWKQNNSFSAIETKRSA